ncbi:unnamed protein product [Schistosoma margrebowiei]|uniref:Uncharacterized protein n=1 Tax=Schistosoma margrebowiei TaxID=48269 RepID=A0A183LC86_9TREM|nr:unnamed protein product [Schistosoma margrebowiei]
MKLTSVNPVNANQSMCGQCEDKNAVVTCSSRSELRPCKETDGINKTQGFKELITKGCQSSLSIETKSNSALQTEAINDPDQYNPSTKTPLTTKQSSAAVSHITSTLCKTSAPVEIYFTPSITYAEKLLLRLHRNSKLQQSIRQDSVNSQKVSEGTFLPNLSIGEFHMMYPITHESNENYSSIPFFDESLCSLTKQKENTDQIHNGQCSQWVLQVF